MSRIERVDVAARALRPFSDLYGAAEMQRVETATEALQQRLRGGVVWNVNSTARGGGVAELLRAIVGYTRGAGIDCRWLVIGGDAPFFRVTKRLHNALHGDAGDGAGLSADDRTIYERVSRDNAGELTSVIEPGDVVILHDPQTAGLIAPLAAHGAVVVWRCHVGSDRSNEHTRAAWEFLSPYLHDARAHVFTREAYVTSTPPGALARDKCVYIPPTIDPTSPKNQGLEPEVVRAILVQTGLIEGPPPAGVVARFQREDGTASRVSRAADILRLGRAPAWDEPVVVQVSRWDRLKDHTGVLTGFAQLIERGVAANLILAGPNVKAVADDPEGAEVFEEVAAAWRALPQGVRRHVQLANLPMADAEENGAIVNAVQRHATVVVQKSLQEGFGLTVAEAMWKGRPVVASRVGGIQDQIVDGVSGLFLDDPRDPAQLADALARVLGDSALQRQLGGQAVQRVKEQFLNLRSMFAYADLILRVF